MSPQPSKISPHPQSPIREYARRAVEGLKVDQRSGVLAWRIATYLITQAYSLRGRQLGSLEDAPARERDHYLSLANVVIALSVSIDTDAPPTPGEIARYEQRKSMVLAKAKARHEAARLGHELEMFRPGEYGYELAACRRCHAGVSIHIETAEVSAASLLREQCAGTLSERI